MHSDVPDALKFPLVRLEKRDPGPLWTFIPNDKIAFAVAVGPLGETTGPAERGYPGVGRRA